MVKAAENPSYPDWHVVENDVWVDDAGRRIEVYRLLRRYVDPQSQYPRLEDRDWRFVAVLEELEPPTVSFSARGWHIPSHAWPEQEAYFDRVWSFLGGKPAAAEREAKRSASGAEAPDPSPPAPDGSPAAPAEKPAQEPPVDLPG